MHPVAEEEREQLRLAGGREHADAERVHLAAAPTTAPGAARKPPTQQGF